MSRFPWWFGPSLVAAATACAESKVCDRGSKTSESRTLVGSRVFSSSGERESLPLSVALAGLPKLWPPEGALQAARLTVHLGLGYDGVPADGTVEMPGIVVLLDDELLGASAPYPGASGLTVVGSLLRPCEGSSGHGCCAFGARECDTLATLAIERVEGEPFPPLDVSWEISASASVDDCPFGESNPALRMELVGP